MNNVLLAFPEGKHKALTLSYDDGRTADRRLVRLLNDYGIKATFHLNSGLAGEDDRIPLDQAAELYQGHEIAAHTVNHPTLARCAKEQVVSEIVEDRRALEKMTGYPVRGFSYPNGSLNRQIKEILPVLGIDYARTVASHGDFYMPDDLMEWNPTCHHNQNLLALAEKFKQLDRRQYLYMMYVWGHSYEFDQNNNWELIESFCESAGRRDDTWYATNIEISDYLKCFNNLRFAASMEFVYNPSFDSVWLDAGGTIVEAKGGSRTQLL